jgi:hypothetical protein
MRRFTTVALLAVAVLSLPANVLGRTWTDKTGKYKIDANLIAFNDKSVVLQRADHELGMVSIDALSQADQEYLKSKAAAEESQKIVGKQQTWKLANGMQLVGRVVGYARKQITLKRERGKIYVNDRVFENLPSIYQMVIPKIVANVEHLQRDDRSAVEDWLVANKGRPQTVAFDGVMMELENGDEYCVPLFLFSPEDQQLLKPGWDAWAAAAGNEQQKYDRQSEESFMLQSLAAARQRDAQVQRLVAQMQLNTAVLGGATSLWEVTLYPQRAGRPIWVTEAGENSAQAIERARQQYPGYAVGPVRKVAGY